MKLLLINTPIDIESILGNFDSIYDDMKMVPTGMASLAGYVRANGIEVQVLDQFAECLSMDEVYERVKAYSPDLIGYSSTTPNYYAAIYFLRLVREKFPHIKTVMGGQHPSVFPEHVLRDEAVDFIICDEGEYPLLGLCQAIKKKETNFEHINALCFKKANGEQVHNKRGENVKLDNLPFPAYDLLPMHLYNSPSYTKFAYPVYQMIASRGCPFTCTYCINAELDISALYRKRNIGLVVDEMEMLHEKYGAKQIQFWDPIFPLGRKHAFDFCAEVVKRGLQKKIVWSSTTRCEFVTKEMADAMYEAGCRGIGFGLESGVQELLDSVNKKSNLEQARNACRIASKAGLVVMSGFILGFPGETKEMTQQTIDFAKSLDLHYAQFSIMVPYPGTPLFKQLERMGEITSVDESDCARYNQSVGLTDMQPIYVPKGREAGELKEFQRKAYTQFYFRPRMLLMHLPHLKLAKIYGLMHGLKAVLNVAYQNMRKHRVIGSKA